MPHTHNVRGLVQSVDNQALAPAVAALQPLRLEALNEEPIVYGPTKPKPKPLPPSPPPLDCLPPLPPPL